ncbi:MAG TPA: ATP-binding protein [Candidatus Kapabacteria bacterium]
MIDLITEATELFASSLDYERTLARITERAVPQISDWCSVDIVNAEHGGIDRLAVSHIDPEKVKWARELARKFPFDPNAPTGVPRVIRTGKSEYIPEITPAMVDAANLNEEQRNILDRLGLNSIMIIPLAARSIVLGAITFVMAESGRHFGEDDLTLAEDLGRLAGLAVDNAMLYRAAQQEIASRKETELELRKAKEITEASERQLAIANKAKDRFLAILSHELRTPLTPLTPVLATVQMLQEENTSAEMQQWLDIIERNTQLEVRLIDDLLDLTRISNGKLRLKNETANLNEIVQSALSMYGEEIRAKNLQLETHWDAKGPFVEGDPARLQQIFWNLLKNAIKFTPEGKCITVRTSDGNGRVTVEVEDTGMGMTEEEIDQIFEPFEQGKEVAGQFGGLGLGLAISKLLVEAHGGSISARSDGEGKGSVFSVDLVQVMPTQSVFHSNPVRHSRPDGQRPTILLIDDHSDTSTTVAMVLERKGYSVRIARTAQEALDAMNREVPQLIISDIGLPDESGLTLLPKLKKLSDIPAIALSGFGSDEDRERSREAGFNAHMTKPFSIVKLDETIAQLLDGNSRTTGESLR